jgi:hypothetical protein
MDAAKLARKYWVVSQNVNSIPGIVEDWERVVRSAKVAVMGWGPEKRGGSSKELGYKFAHEIKRGHVILVGRGTGGKRELVACGVVHTDNSVSGGTKRWVRTRTGQKIRTPHTFGSSRLLFPFKSLNETGGASISFLNASSQRQAIYKLDPNKAADNRICRWLRRQLQLDEYAAGPSSEDQPPSGTNKKVAKIVPPDTNDEPYFVMSRKQSRIARRREAKLVKQFLVWSEGKGNRIEGAMRYPGQFSEGKRTGQPCCDLFDADQNLLIEAKSEVDRHHIRMAIGQLADYAHLHRTNGNPDPRRAILLPSRPEDGLESLLNSVGIVAIWRSGDGFSRND